MWRREPILEGPSFTWPVNSRVGQSIGDTIPGTYRVGGHWIAEPVLPILGFAKRDQTTFGLLYLRQSTARLSLPNGKGNYSRKSAVVAASLVVLLADGKESLLIAFARL
jgi:hypothetical protein